MEPKVSVVSSLLESNVWAALLIAAIVIIVSFPLSWLAALIPAKLQRQLQQTLSDRQRLNVILDKYVLTSSTDLEGIITDASQAFCELNGFQYGEVVGKNHNILRHPETPLETYQKLWKTISAGKPWVGELKNLKKQGEAYWLNTVITPKRDETGVVVGYTQISHDVTDKKRIEKLSVTDALTQLYNRVKTDDVLAGC
jgi:PAS domain S-box-containing protein